MYALEVLVVGLGAATLYASIGIIKVIWVDRVVHWRAVGQRVRLPLPLSARKRPMLLKLP